MMEASVRKLFERYERCFKQALDGDMDMRGVASLYASHFIAATPAGVMTGRNNDKLKQVMAQGYAHYRAIGTKEMRIRDVRLSPIDEHHCVAHVAWKQRHDAALRSRDQSAALHSAWRAGGLGHSIFVRIACCAFVFPRRIAGLLPRKAT